MDVETNCFTMKIIVNCTICLGFIRPVIMDSVYVNNT